MQDRTTLGLAVIAAAVLLAAPASAAMYRCGNNFQDRPCDGAGEQQVIRPGKGAAKALPAASAATPAAPAKPTPQR
jgi:hypothetical protein